MEIKSKGKVYKVLVDKDDYKKISGYTWWIKQNNYVYTNTKGVMNRTSIYLHRLIMDAPKELQVDHINHNPLDNRRKNLRLCNGSQQNINKSNRYSGVSRFREKWRSRIKINGKEIHLGIFKTREEALNRRIKEELKLFGKYSKHYEKTRRIP